MILYINTQASAGIVSSTGKSMYEHKGIGLVPEIFDESVLNELYGHIAIGHVRYSIAGSSTIRNAQAFSAWLISSSRVFDL